MFAVLAAPQVHSGQHAEVRAASTRTSRLRRSLFNASRVTRTQPRQDRGGASRLTPGRSGRGSPSPRRDLDRRALHAGPVQERFHEVRGQVHVLGRRAVGLDVVDSLGEHFMTEVGDGHAQVLLADVDADRRARRGSSRSSEAGRPGPPRRSRRWPRRRARRPAARQERSTPWRVERAAWRAMSARRAAHGSRMRRPRALGCSGVGTRQLPSAASISARRGLCQVMDRMSHIRDCYAYPLTDWPAPGVLDDLEDGHARRRSRAAASPRGGRWRRRGRRPASRRARSPLAGLRPRRPGCPRPPATRGPSRASRSVAPPAARLLLDVQPNFT